jgi:hypothetical protein
MAHIKEVSSHKLISLDMKGVARSHQTLTPSIVMPSDLMRLYSSEKVLLGICLALRT